MANEDHSWRTHGFRQSVVAKIDEAIQQSGMPTSKNSAEMENHVFQKAKSREEYLGYVARLILHVREMNSKKSGMAGGPNQGGQDTISLSGSRANQMLMNTNMGNPMGQQVNMVPQNANNQMNTATNLLQNLNQRPNQNQMQNIQNKMPGPGNNQMMGNVPMQMGNAGMQMSNMNNMAMSGQNQAMANIQLQNQMQQAQMGNQLGGPMMNQMTGQMNNANNMQGGLISNMNQANQMGQMSNANNTNINTSMSGPNVVQSTLGATSNIATSNMGMNQMGQGMGQGNVAVSTMAGTNMGPGNMTNQTMGMGSMNPNMLQTLGGNHMGPNNMGPNSMGPNSMGPNAMGPNAMGPNTMAPNTMGANNMGHNNMGPGNMVTGPMGNMQQQIMGQHMPRKPGDAMMMNNAMFQGPRQMPPNQFLHQSPSPSAPSPAGVGSSGNQMVASPALVPSPSPQMSHMPQQRSVGMAPSPSSSLNTPGQAVPTASPLAVQQEEQAYREKARQLSKYIEPLRRMIARIGNDDVEKLSKFKKLLEILSNPTQRIPLETLLKCEVVLEKMDLKRSEGGGSAPAIHPHLSSLKEHHIFNPLLEAVSSVLQSPTANHTLYRTFGPTMSSLLGPEIKNTPSSLKRSFPEDAPTDISDVLQGEIARLDQRFKVSLDPTHQPGSRSIQLLCCLDDKFLPSVPPVSLYVPEDYPQTSPQLSMAEHEYGMTEFLSTVQKALQTRITKLPRRFSISQLLDTWEMSVRQACAPTQVAPSTATVLLGL
ncbi:mediator of RNA polymerase II transcription subunit 15-like isoform X2 [Ctenocephalides felis]|uniref:mediator of RNA polymerase II transcription subunit 15-like isoform X2 n=1 Tax=Ctenocephalides felis TaxID=7515 RepID=UPI000E6E32EF|nr:mediator of RNA polymerase II transcription subunit 15-like isoform X2 [Ctenocephalides felis]